MHIVSLHHPGSHFCFTLQWRHIFVWYLGFFGGGVFPLLQATELESLVICLPLFNGSCSYSKLPLLLAGKTHWKTRSDSPKAPRSQLFHHRCSSRDPQHGPRQQTFMLTTSTCLSSANIIEAAIQVLTLGNCTIHGMMSLYLRALGLIIMYQWDTVENSSTCGLDALQSSTNAQAARPQCLAHLLGEIWENDDPWVSGLFPEFLSCKWKCASASKQF